MQSLGGPGGLFCAAFLQARSSFFGGSVSLSVKEGH